jgi:HEAT repeat protein
MGMGASFQVLAEFPPEQRLAMAEAALRDSYLPFQTAGFDLLKALGRHDLLVARYPGLPPELRLRMSKESDAFLPAALDLARSDREGDRRAGLVVLAALDPYGTAATVARALDDRVASVRDAAAALIEELGARYYYHLVAARLHGDPESRAYIDRHRGEMLHLLGPVLRLFPRHEKRVFFDIAIESEPESFPLMAEHVLLRGEPAAQQAFLHALTSSATEHAVRVLFRLAAERPGRLREAGVEVLRRRADAAFASLVAATLARLPREEADALAARTTDLPWWPAPELLGDLDAAASSRLLDFAARSGLPTARRDEHLLAFLRSPYPETRIRVLSVLQVLEHPQFAAIAEGALDDPADEVKLAAARALIGVNPPHKVKLLMPLLNAPSEELRRLAMREVASASLERFLKAFDKLDARTRDTAAKAIAKIDGRIVERLADEVRSADPDRRLAALRVVGVLDAEEQLREALIPLLGDPDRRVRATVLRVVQVARHGDGFRLLMGALEDPDRRVRANAVQALEDAGDARAVPVLLLLLDDADNRVRANAAKALVRFGRPEGRTVLEGMLRHADPRMRLSAAWVFGHARIDGAAAVLRERAPAEPHPAVRAKIADALARLQEPSP